MRVLPISDTQIPFDHPDSLPFLDAVHKKYKIQKVLQVGDLIDQYAFSQYAKDPNAMSAGCEGRKTRDRLSDYYALFSKVDVIIGNHEERRDAARKRGGLTKEDMRPLGEVLNFPKGWQFIDDIVIDNVMYEHGHLLSKGRISDIMQRAVLDNMMSTVFGHFHSAASIMYFCTKRGGTRFAMNVGCLMDVNSYAAEYGKSFRNKPVLGTGVVIDGMPIFIPMVLGPDYRWVGKL